MATLVRALVQGFFDNPVLTKELRIGMREKRVFIMQLTFLVVLSLAAIMVLSEGLDHASPRELPDLGQAYYQVMFWVQLCLILMITPSLTCGSITGEKERKSLDMMLASRLTAAEIIGGKLGFAMAYMSLLLFSSLPLMAVAFFLGGVSPWEVFRSYLELAVAALLAAEMGLFFSAREKRSAYATNQTYGLLFLCLITVVPMYAAVREAGGQAIGLGGVLTLWHLVSLNALYLAVFLFLKALNHLQPKALHVRIMAMGFIPYYISNLGLMVAVAGENAHWGSDDGALFWNMLVLGHLFLAGLFLNDPGVGSRTERERFQGSLFSRAWFWMALLCSGLIVSGVALGAADEPSRMIASAGYGVVLMLSFAVITRSVHTLVGGKIRFSVLYFLILALACFLPVLGLLGQVDEPGIFSGVYLSPMLTLSFLWDPTGAPIAEMSTAAYLSLAAVLGTAARFKRSGKQGL